MDTTVFDSKKKLINQVIRRMIKHEGNYDNDDDDDDDNDEHHTFYVLL